jgi:hypothetical protein
MPTNSITIPDSSAVDNTFILQDQSKGLTKYIDPDTSLVTPLGLSIEHTVKPAGQPGTDRHIVKAYQTFIDANGVAATAVVSIQLSVPRHGSVSDTVIKDLWAYAAGYVNITDNVKRLVDGINY